MKNAISHTPLELASMIIVSDMSPCSRHPPLQPLFPLYKHTPIYSIIFRYTKTPFKKSGSAIYPAKYTEQQHLRTLWVGNLSLFISL